MRNPRMVYPVGTGLIPVFERGGREQRGRTLETTVLVDLERRGYQLGWIRVGADLEVDVFAEHPVDAPLLVQVSLDTAAAATWDREVRALHAAVDAYPEARALLVTLDMLRPSKLYVCLYLSTHGDASSFERIAEHLGIGVATARLAVRRLTDGGLIDRARRVRQSALFFGVIIHAVRHVHCVAPGGLTRGARTAEAAQPLASAIAPSASIPVWPDPEGDARGYALEPLHASAPAAARRDPGLHALLALVDNVRIGQARIRSLAIDEATKRLSR